MKICIIGASTIGSIYGIAFQQFGHDISFYVRQESFKKYDAQLQCQLLDERNLISSERAFKRTVFSDPSRFDEFDLIMVCVRHYQIHDIVTLLANTQQVNILFFGNNWDDLKNIYKTIKKERVFFGMPRAGGSIDEKFLLTGGLFREVILGESNNAFYQQIHDLFRKAQFTVVKINDMQSWYWTHMVTTVAWITGAAKRQSFTQFSFSIVDLRKAIFVGREALKISKARGANIDCCQDASIFKLPATIAAIFLWIILRKPIFQAISGGHATPEDLQRVCYDVYNTGKEYNIKTPLLETYIKYVNDITEPSISDQDITSIAPKI